jgi:cytochrome c oxidase assembly factor 5
MQAGHSAADCLRPPLVDTLSKECQGIKYTYGVCKRNLIDMRKRFRGPIPVDYDGSASVTPAHQLYSGFERRKGAGGDAGGAEAEKAGEAQGKDKS